MKAKAADSKYQHSLADTSLKQRRWLRTALVLFFVCMTVPLVVLFELGYSQLQRESFFQYRMSAEDLVSQISQRAYSLVEPEEKRAFDEYGFISIGTTPLLGLQSLSYSPLSVLPPQTDVPGLVGYFQIDPDGTFQSPLLPNLTESELFSAARQLGFNRENLNERLAVRRRLQSILVGSNVFRDQIQVAKRHGAKARELKLDGVADADDSFGQGTKDRVVTGDAWGGLFVKESKKKEQTAFSEKALSTLNINAELYNKQSVAKQKATPRRRHGKTGGARAPRNSQIANVVIPDLEEAPVEQRAAQKAASFFNPGLVVERSLEQQEGFAEPQAILEDQAQVEALVPPPAEREIDELDLLKRNVSDDKNKGVAAAVAPRPQVLTFEASIDPLQFIKLENGDFVFYRKVWQERRPYIQGFIVQAEPFLKELISNAYFDSTIGQISRLTVGFAGEVATTFETSHSNSNRSLITRSGSGQATEVKSTLLYRSFLPAPLDGFELLFSVEQLPENAGAVFLSALAFALGAVLIIGLWGLYRLGVRQIRFAQERSNFVSAVSHELKTPLTSIRMYGEMLRSGYVEQDEQKRRSYYDFIFFESERLSRLISNVLQLARIGNSRYELELNAVTPKTLIDLVQSKVISQIESAGFQLNLCCADEKAEDPICVEVDEDSFAAIVINLVDNAMKFSKDSTKKEIDVGFRLYTAGSKKVVFFVRDYGPGIDRSQMKRIFQLFYRAQSEMTRTTPGTGIGLALVKELAAKMQAKVDVSNKEPGAEFQIIMRAGSC